MIKNKISVQIDNELHKAYEQGSKPMLMQTIIHPFTGAGIDVPTLRTRISQRAKKLGYKVITREEIGYFYIIVQKGE